MLGEDNFKDIDDSAILDASVEGNSISIDTFGNFLCIAKHQNLVVINLRKHLLIGDIPIKNVKAANFSPKSTYMTLWSINSSNKSNGEGNFLISKLQNNPDHRDQYQVTKIFSIHAPHILSSFMHWSVDEMLCMHVLPNKLNFYEDGNFVEISHSFIFPSIRNASLSPHRTLNSCYIVISVHNQKDLPSFIKMFKYPALEQQKSIASRSFFNIENFRFEWNLECNTVLALGSRESDENVKSYYGTQALYLLSINGDSFQITTDESKIIHDVSWSPNSKEFAVLHGNSPSKCSIFNIRGDLDVELSNGPFSKVLYNPFGSLLCLYGMGNLSGKVEFWNMNTKKQVSVNVIPHATGITWLNDGCHVMFYTTSPQLRVDNGFRIVHYTGDVVDTYATEKSDGKCLELSQIEIIPNKDNPFTQSDIISPSKPRDLVPKTSAYVPKRREQSYFSEKSPSKREIKNKGKYNS